MKKFFLVFCCFFAVQALVFAGAGSQASSSAERGNYLAGLGRVIPPEEIYVDSYIAQSDYGYPFPDSGALRVIPAAGFRGGNAYLLMGLRGKKEDFSALPPLNISFVIDISGSMAAQDKLEWIKESFHIFIEQVRPQDFVSVVIFDDKVELLIRPVNITSRQERDQFKREVDALRPRGSTNIYGGMEMGYQQVEANFRPDYSNRVILLTDGMDNVSRKSKKEFLDFCTQYKEQGINISTIALGEAADISLMVDMAIAGGGSSRFISDRAVMEQTFGSELDRLVVAAARNLEMELVLSDGISLKETWGYSYWTSGRTVHYTLDTLHNGDYETIVAEATLSGTAAPGTVLGNFSLSYADVSGRVHREGPFPIILGEEPAAGTSGDFIADRRVREAEGYIALARGLIDIGNRAPPISRSQQDFSRMRNAQYTEIRNASADIPADEIKVPDTPDMAALRKNVVAELDALLETARSLKAYLESISTSLGGGKYAPEIRILENYETSFGRSLGDYLGE